MKESTEQAGQSDATKTNITNWFANHKILSAAGAILLIGIIFGLAGANGTQSPATSNSSSVSKPAVVDNSIKGQVQAGTTVGLNEEATYKSVKIKVTSATTKDAMSEFGQSDIAEAGTKFLVVDLTVTNLLDSPINYKPFSIVTNDYKMINQEDTRTGAFMTGFLLNTELSPSVPKSGYALYVVPADLHHATLGGINNTNGKYLGVKLDF